MIIKLGQFKSENELVAACKQNNRQAQRTLFDLHAPVMLTVCRRYIRDRDISEELMIVGFTKVFGKLEQYKFKGSLQGWIRTIMVNTCLEWIRKNKEMYKEVDIDDVQNQPFAEDFCDQIDAEQLMTLVEQLPQGYRAVFNMYAIEGYTHEEIASSLDISIGTSKSQLSRARRYLQAQLIELERLEKRKSNGR